MKKVLCNPINVNYRYQFFPDPETKAFTANREAADPSLICWQGRYYIFASVTLGVWVSDDLVHWENHRLPDMLPLYDYAPDVRVLGDQVYFCASGRDRNCDRFRTRDILNGPYERLEGGFPFWDPNLFVDDDGRVYFYWGCSDETPIYGVELDRETLVPLGERRELISGHPGEIGYERNGEDHSLPERPPYIEGAWMDKFEGRYYLQYACPGTEFNIYADGVYVAESPLGPFTLAENNPYSYHPGGFMPGAGHGSTMRDRYGNLWHTASMRISVNHMFERRVGLWPAGLDEDGELFCNQRYGDWPLAVPEGKADPWREPEWFLLSHGKAVTASSFTEGHEPALVSDEDARTSWQAVSDGEDEWLCMDLGKEYDVRAVQINFADGRMEISLPDGICGEADSRYIDDSVMFTRWKLEGSADGKHFDVIEDKTGARTDLSHDMVVREDGMKLRYLRLSGIGLPYGQAPCVSGLRVFGLGDGEKPAVPDYTAVRTTGMDMEVSIRGADAAGWNILWGASPEKLYHSCMVFSPRGKIGALVEGRGYYVRVDAFNENGITHGETRQVR